MTSSQTGGKPECDLIMKGGVTSGVVYPLAITEIADKFYLRGIGGTSAGAIAGSLAAAAEYRRRSKGENTGFEEFKKLPTQFGAPAIDQATGRRLGFSTLEGLFQAQGPLRPLFRLAKQATAKSKISPLWAIWNGLSLVLPEWSRLLGIGLLLSTPFVVSALLWVNSARGVLGWGLLLLFFCLGTVVTAARASSALYRAYVENGWALCRGYDKASQGRGPVQLTEWIHNKIQSYSGLGSDDVLTFAHLEGDSEYFKAIGKPEINCLPEADSVQLRMVTTCLSHGRPYSFPLEVDTLYFCPEEMRELFPPSVVNWMIKHGGEAESRSVYSGTRHDGGPWFRWKTVHKLPKDGLLPVVVAVRMSLSVPLFLSAPNLYAADYERQANHGDRQALLEKVVFTDGGVSSNLPIHFFDSIFPTRPTLGINLTTFPPEKEPAQATVGDENARLVAARKNIWFAASNSGGASSERWFRFLGQYGGGAEVAGFAMAVFEAARNWKDNVQLRLPGFRDRVVDVWLTSKEGGFNLSMGPEVIEELSDRGRAAGRNLVKRFSPETKPYRDEDGKWVKTTWTNHLWARYRIAMVLMSRELKKANAALSSAPYVELCKAETEKPSYEFLENAQPLSSWNRQPREKKFEDPPKLDLQATKKAEDATTEFVELAKEWGKSSDVFEQGSLPSPQPTLQARRTV